MVCLLALALLVGLLIVRQSSEPLRIASGSEGSSTLELGRDLAELMAHDVGGIAPVAVETPGGVRNAELVEQGKVELALAPNNAPGGRRVRTLALLGEEVMHVVLRPGLSSDGLAGLRGKTVAIGPQGSGTEQLTHELLAHFRIDPAELTVVHLGHMEAAEAFEGGQLDAVFCLTGLLAPAVERMLAVPGAQLLSFGDPEDPGSVLAGIRLTIPFVSKVTIPRYTYGVRPEAPVGTIGVHLVLAANESMSQGRAYDLTRAVFHNKVQIIEQERGTLRLQGAPDESELRFALHPGAKRYYHRNEPPVILDWADTISLALTVLLLLYSGVAAVRTRRAQKHKDRVDKFYAQLQEVSERMGQDQALAEQELREVLRRLHEIRRAAFSDLMMEKVDANESFTIFQDYLRTELAQVEAALRELRKQRAQPEP